MSFQKAEQLLELAQMATARRLGVSLDDVMEHFRCTRRTAQRMFLALERSFPDTRAGYGEDGRKRWRLAPGAMRDLLTVTPEELAGLDLAIRSMGSSLEAQHLEALKEKILALVPRTKATRLETDHAALLEAQGLAARPGPRPRADPEVMAAISEAIKACRVLEIVYQGRADQTARRRRVAPLGVMLGLRRYLVAINVDDSVGLPRSFRTDAIQTAAVTADGFERPEDFDLQTFANRAFGTYQNESEFGEVVWRFVPEAAGHAREFEFHPEQTFENQDDGSLIVRFHAAGHLEMCWHLYAWGDKVEVLQPERLRQMTDRFRRSDFPALP